MTLTKQMKEFLRKKYIDIPTVYDKETEEFIFCWTIPNEPDVVTSKFDINQIILQNVGIVNVRVDCMGKGENDEEHEEINLVFQGPVTLRELIDVVNHKYETLMQERGDSLEDLIGNHVFPEMLDRVNENTYYLFCGS